jgi:O-antigen/teichoic acid export membrane protein
MSRTQKSAWSLASGVLYNIAWIATGFFATPRLLLWLGSERFGIYRVLLDWIGYLMLLDLGLSGALMAFLAPRVAKGDKEQVRSLLAAGLRAYFWVIIAMLVAGALLIFALPKIISLTSVGPQELRLAVFISLFAIFLTPFSVFRSLAETRQKLYLYNLLITVQSISMTLLWLAFARAGWGLPGQSLAFVAAQVPVALILFRDARKDYGKISSAPPDRSAMKKLWVLNQPTLTHTVTERIAFISDNIIVAWIMGPLFVVPFYLTQRLMTLAQMQLQSLSHSTWAALAELHSHGKSELLRVRLLDITSSVSGLGVAVLAPIAAFNSQLVSRWVGSSNYAGGIITITACFNIWLWAVFSSWIWPLLGTGQIGRWAPFATVFTLLKVALSVGLTYKLGLIGPLLGTFLSFLLVDSWALPRILSRTFQITPWTLWKTALSPLIWGILYGLALWGVAQEHPANGLILLILEIGLAIVIGLILYWTLSLDKDSRNQWRYRFRLVMSS